MPPGDDDEIEERSRGGGSSSAVELRDFASRCLGSGFCGHRLEMG
jgi:hypothetical protein